jgi:hypothetical protein
MHTFRIFLLSILFLSFTKIAVASDDDPIAVFSFEDASCGAWSRSQQNIAVRQAYLYWIRGFATGYNHGSTTKQVTLGSMPNNDTLVLYVDKFCRENPLLSFIGAAFALVKEQAIRQRK